MVSELSGLPAATAVPAHVQPTRTATLFYWLACVSTVTAILYWRRPDAFYDPQLLSRKRQPLLFRPLLWRPDGFSYLPAGYYHTLARLVALIGYQLPVRYAPHWYAFASWLLLVALLFYLFSPRFAWPNWQKYLLGLALVATTAGNEVFFNLANWPTIISLFWLLLAIADEPKNRRQAVFDGLLLVGAGLNSPFTVCLWVLFLLRWSVRRTKSSLHLLLLSVAVALAGFGICRTRGERTGLDAHLSAL